MNISSNELSFQTLQRNKILEMVSINYGYIKYTVNNFNFCCCFFFLAFLIIYFIIIQLLTFVEVNIRIYILEQ
jgi:hypothetical protein